MRIRTFLIFLILINISMILFASYTLYFALENMFDTRLDLDYMQKQIDESRAFREQMQEFMNRLQVEEMTATAYAPLDPDAVEGMCYIGDPRVTATGARTTPGRTIAVDPAVIPMGARVWIPGVGVRVAEDRGGLIRGNRLDLCMSSRAAALDYGRRRVMAVWVE